MAAVTVKEESEDPDYYQYNIQGKSYLIQLFFPKVITGENLNLSIA